MTTTPQAPGAVSTWALERLALGELPAAEATRLHAAIAADPALQRRWREIQREDIAIRADLPAQAIAREVERRQHLAAVRADHADAGGRPRAWLWAGAVAGGGLAIAAALLLALRGTQLPGPQVPSAGPELAMAAVGAEEDERAKGSADGNALVLLRKRGDAVVTLASEATASSGDLLMVGFRVRAAAACAVWSVDGRGALTRHAPAEGAAAVALDAGATWLAPHAYELDDAPAFERFLLVCAPRPFDVGPVSEALRRWAATPGADRAAAPLPAAVTALDDVVLRKSVLGQGVAR